jgi:hypothetical protein
LQALNGALEVLARAAKGPGENPALADKAVGLARRALQNHEQTLLELVHQVAPQPETASTVNVGELVSDVLRFVRNDAANKAIVFRLSSTPDVLVRAPVHEMRLLLLGICCTLADGLQAETVVEVAVTRQEPSAQVEFQPALPATRSSSPAWPLYELLLEVARHRVSAAGGRCDLPSAAESSQVLRISYPCADTATVSGE